MNISVKATHSAMMSSTPIKPDVLDANVKSKYDSNEQKVDQLSLSSDRVKGTVATLGGTLSAGIAGAGSLSAFILGSSKLPLDGALALRIGSTQGAALGGVSGLAGAAVSLIVDDKKEAAVYGAIVGATAGISLSVMTGGGAATAMIYAGAVGAISGATGGLVSASIQGK